MSSAAPLDLASIKARRQTTSASGDYRDLRDLARSWNHLEQASPIAVPSAYLESVGLRGVSR